MNNLDLMKMSNMLSLIKNQSDIDDLNSIIIKEGLIYKNEVYPVCINPILLNGKIDFQNIIDGFYELMNDMIVLLRGNKHYRERVFGQHPQFKELDVLLEKTEVSMLDIFYRLDCILEPDGIKIIEANTNSPGGILTLTKIHELVKTFLNNKGETELCYYDGLNNLVQYFIDKYRSINGSGKFLVIGNKYDEERAEHLFFSKILRSKGIDAITVDHRDEEIKYLREGVFYGGEKVDLIYRRVFPIKNDMIMSSLGGNVTFLNPLVSSLLASKALFALMHNLKNNELFKHKKFIDKYIIESHFIEDLDVEEILNNKNNYVIKHTSLNCGKGVFIGVEYNDEDWNNEIDTIPSGSVVQKYVLQPSFGFSDNKYGLNVKRQFDFNLYGVGKKFLMPYSRVNAPNVLKSNSACGASEGCIFFEK